MTISVPYQRPRKTPCGLCFVGEAPSDEQVWKRQPFVGPSGRLFNSILRAANIDREECMVTNIYDQKAEDNDCSAWMADKEFTASAFARLAEELARHRPRCIVPLGATALWAFTKQVKIGDFRGAVTQATRIVPGAKLLPTIHPAAILHQWNTLPLVTGDFIKAKRESRSAKIQYPDVTLLLEPDLSEVQHFLKDCQRADLLSTDIETGWGQITNIGFAPTPNLAMNIPFVDLRKPSRSYWSSPQVEVEAWMAIKECLQSAVPKLLQNGPYDIMWLWVKWHIAVRNYLHDTRLLHHALYPELPKGLGSMAANYTRLGQWKNWGHRGSEDKKDD